MPGMQIPHCAAPSSMKAVWSGCGASGVPSPRTVVTARPSAWTARARHELIARPSRRTAHAPQSPRSQPGLDLGRREPLAQDPEERLVGLDRRADPRAVQRELDRSHGSAALRRVETARRPAPGPWPSGSRPRPRTSVMGRAAAAASSAAPRDALRRRAARRPGGPPPRAARNGRGPTAPSAIRASATRPAASTATEVATLTTAIAPPSLQPELVPGLPAPVPGHHDLADQLAGPEGRAAGSQEERVERHASARRSAPARTTAASSARSGTTRSAPGLAVRQIPAERRLVPGEEVGEVPRGGPERGQARRDERRGEQLPDWSPRPRSASRRRRPRSRRARRGR